MPPRRGGSRRIDGRERCEARARRPAGSARPSGPPGLAAGKSLLRYGVRRCEFLAGEGDQPCDLVSRQAELEGEPEDGERKQGQDRKIKTVRHNPEAVPVVSQIGQSRQPEIVGPEPGRCLQLQRFVGSLLRAAE